MIYIILKNLKGVISREDMEVQHRAEGRRIDGGTDNGGEHRCLCNGGLDRTHKRHRKERSVTQLYGKHKDCPELQFE